MLVWVPEVEDQSDFFNLTISSVKVVHFYNLIPLYEEELDYCMKNGEEALIQKINKLGSDDVVNLSRKNSCKKLLGFF